MLNAMTVPILIRLYKIKTRNKELSQQEISSCDLLPPTLMSDNEILWGTHEIVARKELMEDDIDFPMLVEYRVTRNDSTYMCFAWGTGMKVLSSISNVPDEIINNNNCIGVYGGLPLHKLNVALKDGDGFSIDDLRNKRNEKKRITVFKLFELSENMDIDMFNKETGGLTRKEYIEWTRLRK